MIESLRVHRVDERHVIHALGQVRQQVTHPQPALAMLAKIEAALHDPPRLAEESIDLAFAGELLAIESLQVGLVIERINVADSAAGTDMHDAARFGRKVWKPRAWCCGRSGGAQ